MKILSLRVISTITLSLLTLNLTNCSSQNKILDLAGDSVPEWVVDPSVSDGIGGAGIASPSKGGLKFQIPVAELDAKADIASRIQSNISRVSKVALRSGAVNENDDVEQFFSQATKEVIKDQRLLGVKRDKMYRGKDGTLYIHMTMSEKDYTKYLDVLENSMIAKAKMSQLSRNNINKTQEAVKEIFDELEKERKETPLD